MTIQESATTHLGTNEAGVYLAQVETLCQSTGKRLFDIIFAAAALVFLAIPFICVALAMRFADPGPLLYGHRRVGLGGREFTCWKFRTMIVNSEAVLKDLLKRDPAARAEWEATRKLKDDPRVTGLGRRLRETSLDELPQFINVLRGEMSLVGPRPIVRDELLLYKEAAGDYLSVRPGLTGLWQISGRNDIDYGDRVALDQEYVRNRTLVRDLRIVLATPAVLFFRRGSY